MKKYFSIMIANIKQNMQSLLNILISFFGTGVMIFILTSLWKYMYSDGTSNINGFTANMTTWYVVIGESLTALTRGSELVGGINDDIRFGNIAYKINKPYLYPLYVLSNFFGKVVSRIIPLIIFSVALGLLLIGRLETFKIQYFPLMLIPVIFGVLIHSFIKITIGLLAFWVEDSFPFTWIYEKLILIFGACFPVDMFPESVRNIVSLTPIYGVIYGPSRLIVNFSWTSFAQVISSQIFWCSLLAVICFSVYKRGARNVNVNGG